MPRLLAILLMSSALLAQAVKTAPRPADHAGKSWRSLDRSALRQKIIEALLNFNPELAENLIAAEAEAAGAPSAALTRDLVVEGWRWEPVQGRMELRMRCRVRRECLPFLAYVSVRDPQQLRSGGFTAHDGNRPGSVVVKAGEHVLFTVQHDGFRLSMPVLCLNSGRAGEVIRVRNAENRILRAVVVGAGRVQPPI
jgi:hypothetical protein